MIGRLKVLGLAVIAVLAVAAAVASGASAVQFHSESEKTFFRGEQVSAFAFDTTAGSVKCKKVTYTGESLTKTSESLTLAPVYEECTAFGLASVVHMNGCTYKYTTFIAHLECPAGQSMTITIGSPVVCTLHRYTGSRTFYLSLNEGVGSTRDIKATSEAGEGTSYEVTYKNGGTEGICGKAGSYTNGKATGSFTLKGYKNAGLTEQTGIWVE
jgi:hypothetical protein